MQDAQNRLRVGQPVFFQLVAGAPASYDETKIAPRDAFLALSFDDVLSVRRGPVDNPLWKPYEFEIRGDQSLVLDVEVVIGISGNLERIEIFARPPHPF